jgi:nicotinamide riboside kinase
MFTSNERFKKGDTVICIINSRATLTVGKEYLIREVYIDDGMIDLILLNDDGIEYWYDQMRFIPKNEFRDHVINDILK